MKNIVKLLLASILMLVMVAGLGPQTAQAFDDRPVGFVVIDHDGGVNGKIYKDWRSMVKMAYHFPYYQIIDGGDSQKNVSAAINDGVKLGKESMADLAEQSNVDVLVVARVYDMDEYMVQGLGWRWDNETYIRIIAAADLYIYKKDGEKYLYKKVRERELKEQGNYYEHPDEIIKWKLSDLVNKMEDRPKIGSN